jgi:hypothetical protein
MSQELHSVQPKLAFAELGVQPVFAQLGQDNVDMPCMHFFILGIYQDIINEYHYKLVQLRHKY